MTKGMKRKTGKAVRLAHAVSSPCDWIFLLVESLFVHDLHFLWCFPADEHCAVTSEGFGNVKLKKPSETAGGKALKFKKKQRSNAG